MEEVVAAALDAVAEATTCSAPEVRHPAGDGTPARLLPTLPHCVPVSCCAGSALAHLPQARRSPNPSR